MEIDLNELLLYGGGAAAGLAVLIGIIYALVSRLKKERLKNQLDKEYGER